MKMNRSAFRAMVKECVRECIKEIMQEQIDPTPLKEALAPRQKLINPMDDVAMRERQAALGRGGMIQNQLQRQASKSTPRSPDVIDSNVSGYTNPSDRLKFAAPPARRFDPELDVGFASPSARAYDQPNVATRVVDSQPAALKSIPSPDLLREMFDDTMVSTLPAQMAAERYGPVEDAAAARVANSNPEDLFDGSQNWASLAFVRK